MYQRRQDKRLNGFGPLSSFLLGAAIAATLNQTHVTGSTSGLTAFGWALVAALAGCLIFTIFHWQTLMTAVLPAKRIWQKSLLSGVLIAFGLWFLGLSLHAPDWTPASLLPLTLTPWASQIWRVVARRDVLDNTRSKLTSVLLVIGCALLIAPEVTALVGTHIDFDFTATYSMRGQPRLFAVLSVFFLAAATSLSTAQERRIPSLIYWSIPVTIAACVLGLLAWISVYTLQNKTLIIELVSPSLPTRAAHAAPALFFGMVFFAIKPRIQVKSALVLGKEAGVWWQNLGLISGLAFCFIANNKFALSGFDVFSVALIMAGLAARTKFTFDSVHPVKPLAVVDFGPSQKTVSNS